MQDSEKEVIADPVTYMGDIEGFGKYLQIKNIPRDEFDVYSFNHNKYLLSNYNAIREQGEITPFIVRHRSVFTSMSVLGTEME